MSDSVSESDTNCDDEDVPAAMAVGASQEFTASSAVTSVDDGENDSDGDEYETSDEDESDEEESGSSDDDDDDDDDGDGDGEEDEGDESDSGNNTNGYFHTETCYLFLARRCFNMLANNAEYTRNRDDGSVSSPSLLRFGPHTPKTVLGFWSPLKI